MKRVWVRCLQSLSSTTDVNDSQLPSEIMANKDEPLLERFCQNISGVIKKRSAYMGKQTLSAEQHVHIMEAGRVFHIGPYCLLIYIFTFGLCCYLCLCWHPLCSLIYHFLSKTMAVCGLAARICECLHGTLLMDVWPNQFVFPFHSPVDLMNVKCMTI